jgi:hypothetical protein
MNGLPHPNLEFPPGHIPTPAELVEFAARIQENFDYIALHLK